MLLIARYYINRDSLHVFHGRRNFLINPNFLGSLLLLLHLLSLVVVRVVPESFNVSLDDDVNEGLEEVEYQPVVDHLDVGRGGEVGADTEGVK